MNKIQIFNNTEFGSVRTVMINDEPYFVGKDVAGILGYADVNKAVAMHVDDEDKKLNDKTSPSFGQRGATLINESGVYSLIFGSKLPTAKKFKHWVTSEILPAIRKHGAYMTENTLEQALASPDFLIKLATELKSEKEKRVALETQVAVNNQIINELKPKADYTDTILQNKGLVTVNQIAKDYGMSAKELNKKLNALGVQYKQSGQWLLYAKYQDKGYTHSKTFNFRHSDGRPDIKMATEWTQKGRLFIYELLKGIGIVPIIECE